MEQQHVVQEGSVEEGSVEEHVVEEHVVEERRVEPEVAHHPRPSAYVGIAVILAVATAVEVALFYVEDVDDWLITVGLLVLMAVKFLLVALWFMHLKFETPIFRRLFYGGIALAVVAYAVFLSASHVFPFFV